MNTGSQKLIPKEQASFTELLDHQEAIILDLENLHYYALNAAASFLWKQMRAGAQTAEDLSAALAAAFGINAEQAELDTRIFLDDLACYGLVSSSPLEAKDVAANPGTETIGSLPAYEPPQLKLSNSLLHITLSGSSTISTAAISLGGGS